MRSATYTPGDFKMPPLVEIETGSTIMPDLIDSDEEDFSVDSEAKRPRSFQLSYQYAFERTSNRFSQSSDEVTTRIDSSSKRLAFCIHSLFQRLKARREVAMIRNTRSPAGAWEDLLLAVYDHEVVTSSQKRRIGPVTLLERVRLPLTQSIITIENKKLLEVKRKSWSDLKIDLKIAKERDDIEDDSVALDLAEEDEELQEAR